MRHVVSVLVAAGIVLATAGQAAPPDYPVNFISVDELQQVLDRGARADIIDVRHWESFAEMHIKGARSMPLRVVPERAQEISKTGLVVFY